MQPGLLSETKNIKNICVKECGQYNLNINNVALKIKLKHSNYYLEIN